MVLNPSNCSNLEQPALKGLMLFLVYVYIDSYDTFISDCN